MKVKVFFLASVITLTSIATIFGQTKSEKFKVSGNCGMCESRIEKAALAVDGVSIADWDKDTKMVNVTFDSSKTDIHKVHMSVAKVGHDTQMHKAKDDVYNKLPECCKYERGSLSSVTSHEGQGHSGCSHKVEKKHSEHSGCTRPKKEKSGSCCKK